MKRRELLKAATILPLVPLLPACSRPEVPVQQTGYTSSSYLSGNFAPVGEEITETNLEVIGSIPQELIGRYVRNGPNPRSKVDAEDHHWFIGDGMVHGVRLDNGRAAWYHSRYTSGPNTNVIGHDGSTWAIVESGSPPVELNYELDPIKASASWGRYTAHPKIDPETGDLHAICYDWADLRDHVKYKVVRGQEVIKNLEIPLPGMPMIHDMSLTRNYVVIYDLPVTLSFKALALGAELPFRWDDEHEARVGLLPRDGAVRDIIWSPLSQNYSYHPMNAYEDGDGNVVIDICRYEKMFAADVNGPFGDSLPRLDRWTINPELRRVSEETVDQSPQEFPRCHPDLNSKPYRYGYTLAAESNGKFPRVYKHDLNSGERTSFDFGPGRNGAENLFVPRENAQSEDDGYLLTYVYDESRKASDLIILDALDLSRPALASVLLPGRVPYGFHGNWIADETA